MSAPQTKSELPKYGATTRLAAISTPRRAAPERKTAAPIASAWVRSNAAVRRVAPSAGGAAASVACMAKTLPGRLGSARQFLDDA